MPEALGNPADAAEPMATIIGLLTRIADRLDAGQPEALDPRAAAAYCSVSVSAWHSMNSRGLVPAPAQLGDSDRLPRWSRSELRAWIQAGSPSRIQWRAMRDSILRRASA